MGDPTLNHVAFRNKFELEKRQRSYADFRSKVVKAPPEIESSSPSSYIQKQKAMEMEEIVKHMKHLPGYLETRKPIQDRALSFGVMDWGRLEKWQDRNNKGGVVRSVKYSPSSSNSSSLFSTDESSPRSSRGQSCSPARQKVQRVTLQSHFQASPNGNGDKFFEDSPKYSKSVLNIGSCHTPPSSCLKEKLKLRDESVNEVRNAHSTKHENVLDSARNQSSPCRSRTPDWKRSTDSSKNPDLRKPRSISPLRRFSFSLMKSGTPTESPVSRNSTNDTNRSHSSPIRRLLDPIFPSKSRQFPDEDSRTKAKTKLDFGNPDEKIRVENNESSSSSRKQAIFQTTVKNDRLLFTFAVENDKDILAATVTVLNSSAKDDAKNRLYTFFTVHEVKKKTGSWLLHSNKTKDHGYVPNVSAQMKVLNPPNSRNDTLEFVLFSLNPNVQPQEELEAIVVKFPRKANREENRESFNTTVILPGGSHGVPSKGEPSPLIYRWRSGGVCDCGGWDEGCRLTTLGNQVRCNGSRYEKTNMISNQFELFVQGEAENKRPIFRLSPLKEGISSIEYDSSLSALQAFSICISVVECQKVSQQTEIRTHASDKVPLMYTPIPGIKRSTTGKVVSS